MRVAMRTLVRQFKKSNSYKEILSKGCDSIRAVAELVGELRLLAVAQDPPSEGWSEAREPRHQPCFADEHDRWR